MEPNSLHTEERHKIESGPLSDSGCEGLNLNDRQTTDVAPKPSNGPTPMRIKRFLFGMLIAAGGIALMLIVAFGMLQGWGVNKNLSLPAIGLCMILGLMMLGGGFGVMATAAGTFDDDEFDRLMAGEKRVLEDGEQERNSGLPRLHKVPPIASRVKNQHAADRLQNT